MQMNCKLGGEPWMIKQQARNTCIIGIDTYHDTDRKGKNITGFVSSLNKNCTQWFSQVVHQCSKQEISDGLTKMMASAISAYKVRNDGVLPGTSFIPRFRSLKKFVRIFVLFLSQIMTKTRNRTHCNISRRRWRRSATVYSRTRTSTDKGTVKTKFLMNFTRVGFDRDKDYIDQCSGWEPQMAYIVLKKRINQRFFRHDEVYVDVCMCSDYF